MVHLYTSKEVEIEGKVMENKLDKGKKVIEGNVTCLREIYRSFFFSGLNRVLEVVGIEYIGLEVWSIDCVSGVGWTMKIA